MQQGSQRRLLPMALSPLPLDQVPVLGSLLSQAVKGYAAVSKLE